MPSSKLTDAQKASIILRVNRALVTEHADLQDGVAEIERLRQAAERSDPGALMLLTGNAGAGKTTILRQFMRQERERLLAKTGHEAKMTPHGLVCENMPNGDERPVVFVNTPSTRSQAAFAGAILRAYDAEVPKTLKKHQILDRLRTQIVGQRTRILCIDEFHHAVVTDSQRIVWELSELVKDILVETRVHIVLCGIPAAALPVDANDQLDRRCRVRFALAPFGWGEAKEEREPFIAFLRDLEEAMDLPQQSDLADPVRAGQIHQASGGLIGRVTRLLQLAAEEGIERGDNRITDELMAWAYDRTKRIGDNTNPFEDDAGSGPSPSPRSGPRRPQGSPGATTAGPSRRTRLRGLDTGTPPAPTYAKRG